MKNHDMQQQLVQLGNGAHALAKLSDGQRQIVVLRDYMDLSYAEIASVLEIAQGTVRRSG